MDTVLPWRSIPFAEQSNRPSEVSTGLTGYHSDRCGFVFNPLVETPNQPKVVANLLAEWSGSSAGCGRLLATINDLPVELREVRAAKGFVAKGAYRRFLDHRTVTLTVPVKRIHQGDPLGPRHRPPPGRAGARALAQGLAATPIGALRA